VVNISFIYFLIIEYPFFSSPELSKSKIEILLLDKKVKKQTALDYVSVIENCELARYAPGSSVNIQSDFEKASRLISTIDKQL